MISHVMTLANGIIGVSVLAMPFCFKQCGIVLATLVLLLSSSLSRLACHFLIKSAVMSRRRNFEFLAFHAFGPMAKFLVELSIIGFLVGTCIAFFVVVGDLGPQIIGEMINKSPEDIRTSFLITTGAFIVLPLGLLRNIDSLASVSTASIAFYFFLVLKVIGESTHHIFTADWFDKVDYWKPGGILQCLPIFALALFCQTQLFEIYEAIPNVTLEKMNEIVRGALNICTVVYLCVGIFGYIAFCTQPFTGNILMSFEPSLTSEIIKIGFVLSVVFSFPLVIFPCRASLNSLLFRRGYSYETTTSYISESRFRCLTILIVTLALTVGVLIPNIEFVLGIIGSTIGVIICLIFPAAFFISISTKNTNERLLAQIIIFIGIWIMILGTYANLYAMEKSSDSRPTATTLKLPSQINNMPQVLLNNEMLIRPKEPNEPNILQKVDAEIPKPKVPDKSLDNENVRQEPPVPVERISENEKLQEKKEQLILEPVTISPKVQEIVDKINNMDSELIKEANVAYNSLKKIKDTNNLQIKDTNNYVKSDINVEPIKKNGKITSALKNDVIADDAIKKEESELAADKEISNVDRVQRREQLDKTLKKHIMQQKDLMQEQKEILKDIQQRKNELEMAKKIEENKEKNEINIEETNKINAKHEEVKLINVIDQEKLKNGNKNEISIGLQPPKKSVEPVKKMESQAVEKDSVYNKDIANNEIPLSNNKQIESKQLDNSEGSKSVKLLLRNSNLSQASAGELIEKSRDPIIKALTKQSIKISNDDELANIPKQDDKKDVNLEIEKINDKNNEKNNKYSIPIVLKMKNQTKHIPDSERSQINQSSNVVPVGRDILQDHLREKRMTETEESDVFKNIFNKTLETVKSDSVIKNASVNKEEICTKEKKEIVNSSKKKESESDKLSDQGDTEHLIKTSVYLSEQDVVKKVSIDPDLAVGDNFVKLKKRDLKTFKFDDENKK